MLGGLPPAGDVAALALRMPEAAVGYMPRAQAKSTPKEGERRRATRTTTEIGWEGAAAGLRRLAMRITVKRTVEIL